MPSSKAMQVLGLEQAADRNEAFHDLVLARIIELASKPTAPMC